MYAFSENVKQKEKKICRMRIRIRIFLTYKRMIGLFPQNSRERDLIFSNNNTIPTFLFILGIFLFPSPSLFFFFRNRIFPFKETEEMPKI